jgi:PTH1 family peptidyl-tRNA hydrolase
MIMYQTSIKAIVGLGNPTPQFHQTRHNIGHTCVDLLASQKNLAFLTGQFLDVVEWRLPERTIILGKSRTYMNQSGSAILRLMAKYNVAPEEITIVYDDMDLPLGKLRIKKQGGSGGHRGLGSIIDTVGTNDFPRLRLGIGHPVEDDPVDHVLGLFTKKEIKYVDQIVQLGAEALDSMCSYGIDVAMNRYNGEEVTQ